MAEASAPVALGVGGIAAILLISGIQGKSVGDILKGDFGEAPNPKGPNLEGGELSEQTKGTNEPIEGAPSGLISPFPKGSKIIWGRSDQGVDGQTNPGSPLIALGNGTVSVEHDPNGFGTNYPVLHIDGDGAFYYGHSIPAVPSGTRVRKGQVIAHANTHGWGNAHTPGWFEIGKWPPGGMSAGNIIRAWLIGLPRQ